MTNQLCAISLISMVKTLLPMIVRQIMCCVKEKSNINYHQHLYRSMDHVNICEFPQWAFKSSSNAIYIFLKRKEGSIVQYMAFVKLLGSELVYTHVHSSPPYLQWIVWLAYNWAFDPTLNKLKSTQLFLCVNWSGPKIHIWPYEAALL